MSQKKIILSAFNIHTGGGYVLLETLFKIKNIKKFILDNRIKNKIKIKKDRAIFIKKKIFDRLFYFHKTILKLIKIVVIIYLPLRWL